MTNDNKTLSIEELESVTGGGMLEHMTEKEKQVFMGLIRTYNLLTADYSAGKISKAELDEAYEAVSLYGHQICEKYGLVYDGFLRPC